MANSINTLSEQQKVCLRLVARGRSSKEIALETGLMPQTVDTYLKAAMARLGVSSRREAARLLDASEAPQNLGSPLAAIGTSTVLPHAVEAVAGRRWAEMIGPPPFGGRLNTLSVTERTAAVLRVAAIGTIVVIALALIIAGALRTFR